MRLIGVHSPPCRQIRLFLFQLLPIRPFHHELPSHFVPILLPIQSCVKNKNGYAINPSVISNQSKPAIGHRPEFVLILDQPIIVQLILIEGTLMVGSNGVAGTQLLNRYDCLLDSLHFDLPINVPLE